MGHSSLATRIFPVLSACMALCACISQQQRIATAVHDAQRLHEPLPLPHRIDETLTIDGAYAIQTRMARQALNGAQPAGYKAGLTSSASQARFHATQPVAGVLLRSGLHDDATLRLSDWPGLSMETEVALRIGTPVRKRVSDVAQLRQYIDAIAPAIELPALHYRTPEQLTASDLIATNVGAATYVIGEFAPREHRDPNEAHARLVCNGSEVNRGVARDALGDQWQAALWLVNTMIDQGWTLEPGQVLLTGALGRMVPATPGGCSADYGNWGTITLTIVP